MHNPIHNDPVIVVGASSAGLFAAQLLGAANIPVHVYERSPTLNPRARTLIVTPEIERVLGHSARAAIVNSVHTLELCTTTKSVPISLDEPDLIIERADLIRLLARDAESAGVRLHFGHSFTGFVSDGDNAVVEFTRGDTGAVTRVRARAIIAADGVRSHVARVLGEPPRRTVPVIQARVRRPTNTPGVGKVWFVPRDTRYFYWLCPESPEYAAVGLVDADSRGARQKLDRFLAAEGLQPLEYQSALIPLYQPLLRRSRRIGNSEVMFVGDAAGQVKVTTVGGSVSGLLGAMAAARSVINHSAYTRELASVERELRLHWLVRSLMNRFVEAEYDVLLHLLGGPVASLLAVHNRDRIAAAFWPILAVQPRLPLLAAQALLRAGFGA